MSLLRAAALLAWLACVPAAPAAEVIDDLGNRVDVAPPAQRIVSLAPHITELLYAAGAGARIVAAVAYSDHPPAARELPRIGDAARIDLERLVLFEPDLVIAWGSGTPVRELAGVRRLGIPLYLSEPRRLDGIGEQLRVFGRLAGTEAIAAEAAADYERRLAAVRERYAGTPRRPVFYQLALQPLLTVNAEHVIHDAVTLCGGVNPFAALAELTPRVDVEAVLAARPAALIHAAYPGEDTGATARFWQRYGLARETRFIAVPGDHIHRATPRILEGVERICAGLAQ